MAKLSSKRRNNLPRSAFVYPNQRRYPIHDIKHARAALSQSARKDTFGSAAKVRRAVLKKYPSLKKSNRGGKKR